MTLWGNDYGFCMVMKSLFPGLAGRFFSNHPGQPRRQGVPLCKTASQVGPTLGSQRLCWQIFVGLALTAAFVTPRGAHAWVKKESVRSRGLGPTMALPAQAHADAKLPAKKPVSPLRSLGLAEGLGLVMQVMEKIEVYHPEPPSVGAFIEAILRAVCECADAHTAYLSPEEWADMQDRNSGELQGVGLELTREEGRGLRVVAAIDDTPAHKAGLKSGDLIVAVGKTADETKKTLVGGLSISEAVGMIRGKAGTPVVLWVKREGEGNLLIVTLVRQKIEIRSVKFRREGDVLYLRLATFDAKTTASLRQALINSRSMTPAIKGYILDLRSNPGGLLDQAVGVTSLFVDKGVVVQMRGRNPKDNEISRVLPGQKVAQDLPLVVLIDQGSASASEIVAGALQDLGRGFVMGLPSFGKGSVQSVAPVSLGGKEMGAIKMTIKRFYTPQGHPIQGHGIIPDFRVEAVKSITYDTSPELREENLPGVLCPEKVDGQDCGGASCPVSRGAGKPGGPSSGPAKGDSDATSPGGKNKDGGAAPDVHTRPLSQATCEGADVDFQLQWARKMVEALWRLSQRPGTKAGAVGAAVGLLGPKSGTPGAR